MHPLQHIFNFIQSMNLTPVVCGIDIGSWTTKICIYDGQKFEVLVNEANFRQTPSLVGYTEVERMIGESALIKMKTNFVNTIRAPMRLIGLEKHFHLVEEELKNSRVQYEVGEELHFYVNYQSENKVMLKPEQVLIALLGKIKDIVGQHSMNIFSCYLTVPSFMSQYERNIIKKCSEVAFVATSVNIIDDWIAIATEYSYFRIKQLKLAHDVRTIIFVDLGFSKFSIFAIQFSAFGSKLIDCEHLRFTGSKNMDHFLAEFYDNSFKKQRNHQKSVFSNGKAYVKLTENIEKQRKILSANNEHHLNIECLMDDQDLTYDMKREQFENIVMPVFGEMASALQNLRSRVAHLVKIHSIQILGGACRIPFVQNLIANIFGMEPSKTLNSSQALVRGATIYGALDMKFLNPINYEIQNVNLVNIGVCWNSVKHEQYFGEDEKLYSKKQPLFVSGVKIPCENNLHFGNEGLVEMYVYYDQNISTKSVGYMRFMTPNQIGFQLDKHKIINAKSTLTPFQFCKFNSLKQEKWNAMQKTEQEMRENDQRIVDIYTRKNHYESLLYSCKDKLSQQFSPFTSKEERANLLETIQSGEAWIESENQRKLGTINDLEEYNIKIESLSAFIEVIEHRQRKKGLIDALMEEMNLRFSKMKAKMSEALVKQQIEEFNAWVKKAYNQMEESYWDGEYLSETEILQRSNAILAI